MRSFSFVHVADIHLGYEQYHLSERREDFERVFTEVIDKTLELKPNFMVIAGDLFHHARPLNITLERAIRCFKKLKDANIPALVVDGSHDAAPNIITGTILNPLDAAGLIYYLPRHEEACWKSDYCYIYGVPNFRTREQVEKRLPAFYELKKPKPREDVFNIFVFHAALDAPEVNRIYPGIAAEISLNFMPDGFNYYAGGHIHVPIRMPFRNGILVYSGSTETVNYEDAYVEKGFNYVEVDGNRDIEITRIKLEGPRRFKVIDKDFSGLTPREITELVEKLVSESDEEGVVIVPVLRGVLPAESTKREVDLIRVKKAAKKALTVHPVLLLREADLPEEAVQKIFTGELNDLRHKSYEYFLQYFSQRYGREEAEKRARIALDIMQLLIKGDEESIRKILEEL